jgi:hypothetical protein
MATYSNNLNPIRINSAIAATLSTNGTLYAVPSGYYAKATLIVRTTSPLQSNLTTVHSRTISVGGVVIDSTSVGYTTYGALIGVSSSSSNMEYAANSTLAVHHLNIGPGHSVVLSGMVAANVTIIGTLFINA